MSRKIKDFPKWQMHRGYWQSGERENSMIAFKKASDLGCEMIEFDVRMSSDKVPVVFHDVNLRRLFEHDAKVLSETKDELRKFEIPSLAEVIHSSDVPAYLNVEVKAENILCFGLSLAVAKEINQYTGVKKILFSSFNPLCLFWLRILSPNFSRAFIMDKGTRPLSLVVRFFLFISQPDFLNVHFSLLDDSKAKAELQSIGLPIAVWTVNDYDKSRKYLEGLAVSIISDLPPQIEIDG